MAVGHVRLDERIADWWNAGRLSRQLEAVLGEGGRRARIQVDLIGDDAWPNDVRIARTSDGYLVTYPAVAQRRFVLGSRHFLGAYLYWMDLCGSEVREITVNGSDGDRPSLANFAPSAPAGRQVPIPDPHFFVHRGFDAERALAVEGADWGSRDDGIVWRGVGNGAGRMSFDPRDEDNPGVLPRLRMCMKLARVAGCDVRITGLYEDGGVWLGAARRAGLAGDPIPAQRWLGRKYAIDIDGQTNTWSNLLVRMLFGCCVFKVKSQGGFRQWYYDRLTPFVHFVPVAADMSDFAEKIDWARSHPGEARAIAEAGRAFALGLDFEAGKRDAVELITANWDKPAP